MKNVKTAVIGCGAISDIYLTNMLETFSGLDVAACCASHLEHAQEKAEKYGIRAASTQEILQDPDIELAVILTPPPTHYELIRKALLAGKHVYTEKPLALELRQAEELTALAAEKGLLLGAAPETFLGSALQTARKALDEEKIGEVTSFHIVCNRNLTILAGLYKYMRQPGGGICCDYGVYYLTALVSLLGPVQEVFARAGNHSRIRTNCVTISPEYGQEYTYDNEAQVNAVVTLKSVSTLSDNCRGLGPAQMARCIREGGRSLVDAGMAVHVLDVIETIMKSSRTGVPQRTATECERPAAFTGWREVLK